MNAFEEFYQFTYVPKAWQNMLDYLENIAIQEDWNYKNPSAISKNTKNPILENYICHTFQRLKFERDSFQSDNEKNAKIFMSDNEACFNTGLFTKNYQYIFAFFEKYNSTHFDVPWAFKGFYEESHSNLTKIHPLPKRAQYFTDISDLLYNTDLQMRININHIIDNPSNKERIPESVRNLPSLTTLFDGAIKLAMKKIEANYKVAVPQYYQGKIQLLIPICLQNPNTVDLALAVTKQDMYYTGHTCLTIDMAYNNARLIAKPDSDWLKP